ncbi:MAG TPA: hypothetical protein VHY48_12645 [Acidobacteriaceae bacterium]|jgi:uncharacterized membrane protein YphA (DoxX/SURF4 family)|nr:hypothetical protein [Acidobacteriaceae bacterium]
MRIGVYVFGLASVAAGILDLLWGEFEPAHQPIQAWGDHIPGVTIFAYIAAIWLIAGGAAILWQQTARFGAAALSILYGIFVLFPLPRFYTAPHFLGHRVAVYIGVMGNICEQIILFVAAAIVWRWLAEPASESRAAALAARWIFGLCSLFFGLGNLTAIETVTPNIPKWMPFGAAFWAWFTAMAFVLAGLAIVSGVLDVLAAWLLGLMLLVFSVLVLTPPIFASPHDHVAWGANAYNLTAVGAAWIVAGWLATRKHEVQTSKQAEPSPA